MENKAPFSKQSDVESFLDGVERETFGTRSQNTLILNFGNVGLTVRAKENYEEDEGLLELKFHEEINLTDDTSTLDDAYDVLMEIVDYTSDKWFDTVDIYVTEENAVVYTPDIKLDGGESALGIGRKLGKAIKVYMDKIRDLG